jgi:hypothetical protein
VDEATNNLLSQLRDIHGAGDPGWWPPAPGWWVLFLIVSGLFAFLVKAAYRKWLARRRRQGLLAALDSINIEIDASESPHEYLSSLNRLFRVVALRAFPNTPCARLQGDEWVTFIRALMPEGTRSEELAVLATGPYEPSPQFDASGLEKLARKWVTRYG